MKRSEIERELLAWMGESTWQADDARFEKLALALFAFQFEANAAYGRFGQARGCTPADIASWRPISEASAAEPMDTAPRPKKWRRLI